MAVSLLSDTALPVTETFWGFEVFAELQLNYLRMGEVGDTVFLIYSFTSRIIYPFHLRIDACML